MIINRRLILAGAAALAFTGSASAQDWKSKYPELTFGGPAEDIRRHRGAGRRSRRICQGDSG
jgi:hypothetical protein